MRPKAYGLLLLLFNAVKGDEYLGCYKDSLSQRLLSDFQINFPQENSPSKCISYCRTYGFKYAGVEFGFECFCSETKPPSTYETESGCNVVCEGDPTKTCGGQNRIDVYDTGGSTPKDRPQYLGCYKERSLAARLLNQDFQLYPGQLTPTLCIQHCTRKGFAYTGLERERTNRARTGEYYRCPVCERLNR